jgi:hypothetical protein
MALSLHPIIKENIVRNGKVVVVFLGYLTRFAQPHLHTYMFCPYVISTLYPLLEDYR